MKKIQFQPLIIDDHEIEEFLLPPHTHSYYELIYIHHGTGIHMLNQNAIEYEDGDLFLIDPEDVHYFEIFSRTHFTFIMFTDDYISKKNACNNGDLKRFSPVQILRNKLFKEQKLVFEDLARPIMKNAVNNIVAYNTGSDIGSSAFVYHQVLSLFGLIEDAAKQMNIRIDLGRLDKEELITFIHQHIYDPGLIQIKNIAKHFNIAESYFSSYFRRNFGCTYRSYINSYRIQLIERRLGQQIFSIKEIADEFGFNDISHLSNYYKSIKKISPSEFRRNTSKF